MSPSSAVTPITSLPEFYNLIDSKTPIVIDFHASWCGPCKAIAPIYNKLAEESKYAKVKYYSVDIDEVEQVAHEVGVRSVPMFATFVKGNKIDSVQGANPGRLEELIKDANDEKE